MGLAEYNSLRKRNAALALIDEYRHVIASTSDAAAVRAATERARRLALELQGAPLDRPYLTKTISQLATALRRAGQPAICIELIEWALGEQLADSFLFTELVQCYVGVDEVQTAEAVLRRAEERGMVGEAIYASLVSAWGRAGRPGDARRIFDRAQHAGVCGRVACTALMDSYVRAGDLAQAQRVFTEAQAMGCLDTGAYAVLLRAYIRAGCAADIARLGRQADDAGCMTDGMRSAVTQVLHRAGRTRQANRFRRRGRAASSARLPSSA